MKTSRLAAPVMVVLAVTFALTGCMAATPDTVAPTTVTPQPTTDPNRGACLSFQVAFIDALSTLTDESTTADDWADAGDQFDTVALKADGDIKSRLMTLVDEWPGLADIVIYGEFEKIDDLTMPVVRACEAAGYPTENVFAIKDL